MKTKKPTQTAIAAAVLATASVVSFGAMAAKPGASERAEIQQTYRAERAACMDGSTTQERGACLAEAAAVRKEALNGQLGVQRVDSLALAPTEDDLMANALSRCDAVPMDVRSNCERRVLGGEGVIVVGSVAEGGVITELVAQAPGDQPALIVAMAEGNLGQPRTEQPTAALPDNAPAEEGLARGTTLYYGEVTQDGEQSRITEYSAADQSASPMEARVEAASTAGQVIIAEPTEPLMEAPPPSVSTLPEPTPQGSGFEPGPTETLSPRWQVQQRFE